MFLFLHRPCQHLLFLVVMILAILTGVRWCEVMSHCGFYLYFPDDKWCRVSFPVSVGHVLVFGEISVHVFYFLIGLFVGCWVVSVLFVFKILFIQQRERERERERLREAKTQAEGETGSMQGAWGGIGSRVSRIRPRTESSAKPLSHPGCAYQFFICFEY